MRSLLMATICLAVLCVGCAVNAQELTKEELAARDFSYQGVGIGTTCEDLLKRFPNARLQSGDKTGITSNYVMIKSDDWMTFWSVEFFNGKAYFIIVDFSNDALAGIGGTRVFEKKLTDTFGISTSTKGKVVLWEFPNVHRRLAYLQGDDASGPMIALVDTAAIEQRDDVQARKLDLGF